jgi:hypothetical protein
MCVPYLKTLVYGTNIHHGRHGSRPLPIWYVMTKIYPKLAFDLSTLSLLLSILILTLKLAQSLL